MYTTPVIFDRAQTDIDGKTSKGFFNYSDFNRLIDNSDWVRYEVETVFSITIAGTALSPVSEGGAISITALDALRVNVENIIAAFTTYSNEPVVWSPILPWVSGTGGHIPNFIELNRIELILEEIHQWIIDNMPFNDVLTSDLVVTTAVIAKYYQSLDMSTYNADVQGTGSIEIM